MPDTTQPSPSATEGRIRQLIADRPADFRPEERIDWIHDADVDQLREPKDRQR